MLYIYILKVFLMEDAGHTNYCVVNPLIPRLSCSVTVSFSWSLFTDTVICGFNLVSKKSNF